MKDKIAAAQIRRGEMIDRAAARLAYGLHNYTVFRTRCGAKVTRPRAGANYVQAPPSVHRCTLRRVRERYLGYLRKRKRPPGFPDDLSFLTTAPH